MSQTFVSTALYTGDSDTTLDDLLIAGWVAWIKLTPTATAQTIARKSGRYIRASSTALNELEIGVVGTTALEARAPLANFAAYAAARWIRVAGRFNFGGGASAQQLFMGSERHPLAAPSAYTAQVDGVTMSTDAGGSQVLGNAVTGVSPFTSPLHSVALFAGYPTLEELEHVSWLLVSKATALRFPASCIRAYRLTQGGGITPDLTGRGFHATPSGTIVNAENPPFWRDQLSARSSQIIGANLPVAGTGTGLPRWDRGRRLLSMGI